MLWNVIWGQWVLTRRPVYTQWFLHVLCVRRPRRPGVILCPSGEFKQLCPSHPLPSEHKTWQTHKPGFTTVQMCILTCKIWLKEQNEKITNPLFCGFDLIPSYDITAKPFFYQSLLNKICKKIKQTHVSGCGEQDPSMQTGTSRTELKSFISKN